MEDRARDEGRQHGGVPYGQAGREVLIICPILIHSVSSRYGLMFRCETVSNRNGTGPFDTLTADRRGVSVVLPV